MLPSSLGMPDVSFKYQSHGCQWHTVSVPHWSPAGVGSGFCSRCARCLCSRTACYLCAVVNIFWGFIDCAVHTLSRQSCQLMNRAERAVWHHVYYTNRRDGGTSGQCVMPFLNRSVQGRVQTDWLLSSHSSLCCCDLSHSDSHNPDSVPYALYDHAASLQQVAVFFLWACWPALVCFRSQPPRFRTVCAPISRSVSHNSRSG